MSEGQNGWNEYSKLVLKELETLSDSVEGLNLQMQELKEQLVEIKAKEDRVSDIKIWKDKMDDIASPTQMKELIVQVEDLKMFKTKAITIFAVVQFGMALAMWITKFFE